MISTRARLALPLLLVVTIAAGCGGVGSDTSPSEVTTTKPKAETTTTAEATTTTTEAPEADAATKAEAASRVFAEGDFPDGWTVAVEAPPYDRKGIATDDCINPKGGPVSKLPLGAAAGGPTMKAPDADAFIGSWAATFADEAQAEAYVAQITAPEHATCTAKRLTANGKDRKDFAAKVTTKPADQTGVGVDQRVASDSYELSEGGQVVSILYVESYRIGRTVVTVTTELGPMEQQQADAAAAVDAKLREQRFGA